MRSAQYAVLLAAVSILSLPLARAQVGEMTILGRPQQVPSDFVPTPHGWFHPSCVIQIEEDEYLDVEDNIRDTKGRVRPLSRCLHQRYDRDGNPVALAGYTPTVNNWVVDVESRPGALSWISANWTVPSNPRTVAPQTLYFFPGLQPLSDPIELFILQPVLGWNHIGHGPDWTIASWNCCRQNNNLHSPLVTVAPGSILYGYVWGTGCNAQTGVCTSWQISTSAAGGGQSTLNTDAHGDVMNWAFSGVLEVYGLDYCSQYPPNNSVAYSNVVVRDINGNQVQPNWQLATYNPNPACSANGQFTNTTATITWCAPLATFPACSNHCGSVIPDGCGGSIQCPPRHACPRNYYWEPESCTCTQ